MLNAHPIPAKEKSKLICKAFLGGAPQEAKGAVFFGLEGVMNAFTQAKASGLPWWTIDNAYFDKHRGSYFRVTRNALQVDPSGKTSDGTRFARLGIEVRERQDGGHLTLVVPQSDQFMKSIGYIGNWSNAAVAMLGKMGCKDVHVHPWQRDKLARGEAFAEKLRYARLVVTHSSAAAITALLAGVPAISTSPTAAAYRIGGPFDVKNVLDPLLASIEERRQFASVLADNQYTLDEFRDGTAWRFLNGR